MNSETVALAGLALLLGLRHGVDADHLAVIDSLARAESGSNAGRAPWCGVWFSAGHGLTILGVAIGLALLSRTLVVSTWLELSGVAVTVTALLALGISNICSALRSGHQAHSLTKSLTRRLALRTATYAPSRWPPPATFGLGMLFALSFDAMSTAALFAAAATSERPVMVPALLGGLFAIGMLLVDGFTGWFSAWCIRRSYRLSPLATRITGVILGSGSLLMAMLIVGQRGMGIEMSHSHRLALSATVVLLVPLALACAWWSSRSSVAKNGAAR